MIYINDSNIQIKKNSIVCLGNFDGLHLGHQKLIKTTIDLSLKHNLKSIVFSFYPHPKIVTAGDEFKTIFTSSEKVFLMSELGVDYFIQYPFSKEFSSTGPYDFIKDYLVKLLNCKIIVVGKDYFFGKNREGDIVLLNEICNSLNIKLVSVPLVLENNAKVSSGTIRDFIMQKELENVIKSTGKPYFIMSQIITGRKLGRTIGFPTINMIVSKNKLLPPNGVYCTRTFINNNFYNSVTNIGVNPTLSNTKKTVETFIFSFNKSVYGEIALVYFYQWIRAEMKFNSIDELKEQISRDVIISKKIHDTISKTSNK